MKIALQSWGSGGDINPFLALSAVLNRLGVRIFSERNPIKQMTLVFDKLFESSVKIIYAAARQLAELVYGIYW